MTLAYVNIKEFKEKFAVAPLDATDIIMEVQVVETFPDHRHQPDE
jgi:hypothetical protein